jgi:hypothetical protein
MGGFRLTRRFVWLTLPLMMGVAGGGRALRGADVPQNAADYDSKISSFDREHWAFQPVNVPALPRVKDTAWVRNPIDQFILAGLEAKGWRPAAPAAKRALHRRLALDLVGLPPSPEEQNAFLADQSGEAWERVVDRLLAHAGYGERWGRHWLDLVRYAESNGYERDGAKPSVWRFRDYVIESFNSDKPFDRFILEQLAGDELSDASEETVTALGYYRLGPWDDEPADPLEDRFDQLDDMVSTTAQVFLGLTLGCARCHDHKFEPLTQYDYYRMLAVFNTLSRFQNGRADLDAPAATPEVRALLADRDVQVEGLLGEIAKLRQPVRNQLLGDGSSRFAPEVRAAFLAAPDRRNDVQKKLVEQHMPALEEAITQALQGPAQAEVARLANEIAALREAQPDPLRAYFLYEPSPTPPVTRLLQRGKATRPGIVVEPGLPAVVVGAQPAFAAAGRFTSSRRLSLARWVASPANPLTARVIVNRVWQYHFGEGLVRTASDFGVMGDAPSHPELLDWLAAWFVQEGWSLKKLHRLIVTSNTWQMGRAWREEHGAADPENRLWWRVPYRRVEVEVLRDSILAVSGRLNGRMFGPAMHPFIPREALEGNSDPDKIWPPFDEVESSRRTIYAFVKRSLVVPFLEVLDLCDTTRSSSRRAVTSVAPQALTLFNGHFVSQQAGHFADRLLREAGGEPAAWIERAYLLALCRDPTALERQAMEDFLAEERGRPGGDTPDARRRALAQMCRVIFNLNEFAYPD